MLRVDNLRIAFKLKGKLSVPVRNVSFTVPENGRVALVGESGCGKSLTAMSLSGLVDGAEISGSIECRGRISYVFQNPMQSLNPVMRIGRQIEECPYAGGKKEARQRTLEALRAVGLPEDAWKRFPCQLSGGQQQRAMIAMALVQNPDLLVADEPTTALDVTTQKEVLDLIYDIAGSRKMAVLLITHNLGLVSRYSSYVNVMYAGEIVERGAVADVLSNPRHPYTCGLVAAVPRMDAEKDAPLVDIPGTVPSPWEWPDGCAFHPRCKYALSACSKNSFSGCPRMAT